MLLGLFASGAWLGCSSPGSDAASGAAGRLAIGGGRANAAGAYATGTGGTGGTPPTVASGGTNALAGAPSSESGGGPDAVEQAAGNGGAFASGGSGSPSGGMAGMSGIAGSSSGGSAAGGIAGGPPANCSLSTPVSFQKDIQGFLAKSCGKTVDGGCHVTDSSKTSLGYNHAYDWITAFAHTGSCGKTEPYAKRFEVVLALLYGPKPPSCPNARQMPPTGMGAPPTACELAALQAWLAEPKVSQMHVPVSDDTKGLYPPGPYEMPPFN